MDTYSEIILSGGHLSALSYIGALRRVDTSSVKRWVGTSAGALIAFMYVAGFPQRTIESLAIRFPFKRIVDRQASFLNIVSQFGLYDASVFGCVIRVLLRNAGLDDKIDFETLFRVRGADLVVTAYCVNTRQTVVYSKENTPHMNVDLAITMSMAIPFVFQPVLHDGSLYIDGGVLSHVPFVYSKHPDSCLVIRLAERQHAVELNLASYTFSILDAISRAVCCGVHTAFDGRLRVVMIHVESMSRDATLSFDVSSDRIHALIMLGENSYTEHFERTHDTKGQK